MSLTAEQTKIRDKFLRASKKALSAFCQDLVDVQESKMGTTHVLIVFHRKVLRREVWAVSTKIKEFVKSLGIEATWKMDGEAKFGYRLFADFKLNPNKFKPESKHDHCEHPNGLAKDNETGNLLSSAIPEDSGCGIVGGLIPGATH